MASEQIIGLNEIGTQSLDSEHARASWRKFLTLPSEVLSRVVVIFGALGLIKLILLIGLRKHLQEIHWRNAR